jgi:hypothetical protein
MLRRAAELAAEGKTGEEIASELGEPAATSYNRRARTAGWIRTARAVLDRGMQTELTSYLGYDKGDPEGKLLLTPATALARKQSPVTSAI